MDELNYDSRVHGDSGLNEQVLRRSPDRSSTDTTPSPEKYVASKQDVAATFSSRGDSKLPPMKTNDVIVKTFEKTAESPPVLQFRKAGNAPQTYASSSSKYVKPRPDEKSRATSQVANPALHRSLNEFQRGRFEPEINHIISAKLPPVAHPTSKLGELRNQFRSEVPWTRAPKQSGPQKPVKVPSKRAGTDDSSEDEVRGIAGLIKEAKQNETGRKMMAVDAVTFSGGGKGKFRSVLPKAVAPRVPFTWKEFYRAVLAWKVSELDIPLPCSVRAKNSYTDHDEYENSRYIIVLPMDSINKAIISLWISTLFRD